MSLTAQPFPAYQYSDHVWQIARGAARTIGGSYVALQWRQETVELASVTACAPLLASELVQQMRDTRTRTVYLASDVPLDRSLPPNSASFTPAPENWDAMQIIADAVRASGGRVLSWNDVKPDEPLAEAASGVFDKILTSRAVHVVTAGTPTCGYTSSYRGHLLDLREEYRSAHRLSGAGVSFVHQHGVSEEGWL